MLANAAPGMTAPRQFCSGYKPAQQLPGFVQSVSHHRSLLSPLPKPDAPLKIPAIFDRKINDFCRQSHGVSFREIASVRLEMEIFPADSLFTGNRIAKAVRTRAVPAACSCARPINRLPVALT
jgi:hypothetical protein